MSDVILTQPVPETGAGNEQVIDECWAELQGLRKQIDADQSEIARLQSETGAMLNELKAAVGL